MRDITYKNKFGRTTILTLNVLYTISIVTFLYSIYCYAFLNIKGTLFYSMLTYSLINGLNICVFYKHRNILPTYHVASFLGFIAIVILSYFSDGINSPVIPFLSLLIFFGYLIGRKYGDIWFIITSITIITFYLFDVLEVQVKSEILTRDKAKFNLIFLFFLIVLLGGMFGRMLSKANDKIKKAKIEIHRKNNEKSVMLREIHHRVKNNLQIVNSLLRIQSRGVKDLDVKEMFKSAQSRIIAMARLHENIYHTEDLKNIDIAVYLEELIQDLISNNKLEKPIDVELEIAQVNASIDTLLPLSLLINEFISNSLKHAFKDQAEGKLFVELTQKSSNEFVLVIGDNGKGIDKSVLNKDNSMGLSLIKSFVKQLNGSLSLLEVETGTRFKILFQKNNLIN